MDGKVLVLFFWGFVVVVVIRVGVGVGVVNVGVVIGFFTIGLVAIGLEVVLKSTKAVKAEEEEEKGGDDIEDVDKLEIGLEIEKKGVVGKGDGVIGVE